MKLTKMATLLATTAMLHGCSTPQRPTEPVAVADRLETPLGNDEMLGLITGYSESMVDITQMRWAPELCQIPHEFEISHDRSSTEHGRKLYYLFTSHPREYFGIASDKLDEAPVGMTLIKQSHKPRLLEDGGGRSIVDDDGKRWQPGEKTGLFVMHRLDPEAPGTDDGWVYATTNPDGTEIIEMGMIESCMSCHIRAPRGRLFGAVSAHEDALLQFRHIPIEPEATPVIQQSSPIGPSQR
jgi:hypothetical protein